MRPIAKAVDITPTNARPLDFDEHFARLRYRLRHGRHTHVTRPVKHSCLHVILFSYRIRSVMARLEGAVSCLPVPWLCHKSHTALATGLECGRDEMPDNPSPGTDGASSN